MKINYRMVLVILLIFTGLSFLHAYDIPAGEVELSIRFYDRRIYYSTGNGSAIEPIFVQVTITNNSPYPYRFKLADERAFSMDLDVRTMTNRQLLYSDSLTLKRTQNSQVFFREITIESRESFSFIENLRDYFRFDQNGSFRVRAFVYPELIRLASTGSLPEGVLVSNYLNLNLRPALINGPDGIPLEMDSATGAQLVKQQLPPDEVVSYMITARQQSQWERFFLYLDPQAMLLRDPHRRSRYYTENEAGRLRMVAEYRQNLQNSTVDGDIVVIPTTFEILRTEYNNTEGTVTVLQKFRMPNYTELRHYRYFLEKRDNFWIIVNYSVQGMGTEAND